MKAIVHDRFGSPDVLELREIEAPTPAAGQALVRVRAASVNPIDWHLMRGKPYVMRASGGVRRPKETQGLGSDLAGVVEAVGEGVTGLRPGDEVFGMSRRTLAELVCVAADALVLKPAGISFEHAASIPVAALTALQGLRDKAGVEPGQTVLVNGASGGVGTFAVQIARAFGAEVTGVCSTRNVELVRSLGAAEVVDYTGADFTRAGRRWDVVFEGVGSPSLRACRRAVAKDGVLLLVGAADGDWIGPIARLGAGLALSRLVSQRIVWYMASRNRADLATMAELVEAGTVTPVIDRTYPLAEAADAIRYLELGHARGKVVVTV